MKCIKKYIIPAICAATVFLLLRCFFFIGYVPSESMEPTIPKGSFIIGTRLVNDLRKGDVVVFRWKDQLVVKRIVAIPGEKIMHAGEIRIIPADCYYVLGDNGEKSWDSRFWEEPFIEHNQILARIFTKSEAEFKKEVP